MRSVNLGFTSRELMDVFAGDSGDAGFVRCALGSQPCSRDGWCAPPEPAAVDAGGPTLSLTRESR